MKILNFGSLNIDYTYSLDHIVQPGETIKSTNLEVFPGGKGLNQSIALAKAGGEVYHAGQIGSDGEFLKQICMENRVHTEFIKVAKESSGKAIIQVSKEGQNSIILYTGANRSIELVYIDQVLENFGEGDVLLLQNEINHVDKIIDKAYEKGMFIALNPSPFDGNIDVCDLAKVDLLFVNEIEGEQISGVCEPEEILKEVVKKYNCGVVLTLGEKGSRYMNQTGKVYEQAVYETTAVDTTAAGDTFTGYFLVEYENSKSVERALKVASKASAIAVSRKGASVSIPTREEVYSEF